jgi:UDP-N-acetylglucosamine:LPS N-acetylglucosamine transferase
MGAGHDGAAAELARQASELGFEVERIDFLDLLPRGIGRLLRAAYRAQLTIMPATWGWILTSVSRPRAHDGVARLSVVLSRRRLLQALERSTALVISTYPLASQALSALRLEGRSSCPVTTFLTDMSVHGLWIAPGVDRHLALHDVPAAQARSFGAKNVSVVGPMVAPTFKPAASAERAMARRALATNGDRPLALVVAGSWGVGCVEQSVDDLLATGLVTPVVVCGNNRQLHRALSARMDVVALGWVTDMPRVLSACDVVIQNAGGLSMLEARQCGLPVITYRSLPGHGVMNAAALEAAGWATWVKDPAQLAAALTDALASVTPAGPMEPFASAAPFELVTR